MKTQADAGDGLRVVGDHGEAESDREQHLRELVETESGTSAGRGKRRLRPEPNDEDQGEAAKEIQSERLEDRGVGREEVAQELEKIVHRTGQHGYTFTSATA